MTFTAETLEEHLVDLLERDQLSEAAQAIIDTTPKLLGERAADTKTSETGMTISVRRY